MVEPIELGAFVNLEDPALKLASRNIVAVQEDATVEEALKIMLKKYRKIPVLSKKDKHFMGFITSVDILDYLGAGEKAKTAQRKKRKLSVPVSRIMTTNVHTLDSRHDIRTALIMARKHRKGAYPILERKRLKGLVTEWDFVSPIEGRTGIKISEVMMRKPMVAKSHFSIFDVARMMVRGGYRRLPVVKNNILVGIATPHDLLSYLSENEKLEKLRSEKREIIHAMMTQVTTVSPEDDIAVAVDLIKRGTGGLPVVEEHELHGIITERDIVNLLG